MRIHMRISYPSAFGESLYVLLYTMRSSPLPKLLLLLLSLSHTLPGIARTLNFTENLDVDDAADEADDEFCLHFWLLFFRRSIVFACRRIACIRPIKSIARCVQQ